MGNVITIKDKFYCHLSMNTTAILVIVLAFLNILQLIIGLAVTGELKQQVKKLEEENDYIKRNQLKNLFDKGKL